MHFNIVFNIPLSTLPYDSEVCINSHVATCGTGLEAFFFFYALHFGSKKNIAVLICLAIVTDFPFALWFP